MYLRLDFYARRPSVLKSWSQMSLLLPPRHNPCLKWFFITRRGRSRFPLLEQKHQERHALNVATLLVVYHKSKAGRSERSTATCKANRVFHIQKHDQKHGRPTDRPSVMIKVRIVRDAVVTLRHL